MFFTFTYVEFNQGKVRIARDTTVNDYLCCNGVKYFTHSSLTNDTCDLSDCVDGSANYSSQVLHAAYQWIILLTMLIFNEKAYLNVTYRCDYSWHGTTPGP